MSQRGDQARRQRECDEFGVPDEGLGVGATSLGMLRATGAGWVGSAMRLEVGSGSACSGTPGYAEVDGGSECRSGVLRDRLLIHQRRSRVPVAIIILPNQDHWIARLRLQDGIRG